MTIDSAAMTSRIVEKPAITAQIFLEKKKIIIKKTIIINTSRRP